MTGYQLRNASRAGIYRHIFPGCGTAVTTWTNLTWKIDAPTGSMVALRYRAAPTVAELTSAMWQSVSGTSPLKLSVPAMPPANFLQVEVSMSSIDNKITPILSELSAGFTCKVIIG